MKNEINLIKNKPKETDIIKTLQMKISKQQLELKSLNDQNDLLRIENNRLIDHEIKKDMKHEYCQTHIPAIHLAGM